ncbi:MULTISPECIES: 2'-5' RNA ligase family protein [unclassified Modestobacter]|uniref:2'-5' RNA ligase family protein n=1 Tax=unclassified Modestobacter TaxID=2643866 RepID=UPI0022AB39DC|nr:MULTISPECIES: 2'-5' RNA ligase family protein [unclassified Modestobacter]MCZ2823710.1 2'-5' RNA ligase family protein [Modestobacter sp. VKM Ac-2981]MCZ2851955.1 2'-5' RNA ligase family protein [Modestobacter sp. VKM Ac-2982]
MRDRPLRADDTFVHRLGAATSPDTAVLGVVVSVPEPWAQLLVEWRGKCGDPQATLVPPHVTLLPPTEVPIGARPAITEHLARVAAQHPPFDMHLSGTGTFRPISEVVFVAVAQGIGDCELIATDVRTGPLARPLSFPYHPHVTVAHDVPTDMLDMAYAGLAEVHAEFRVDGFTEFEQLPSGAWAVSREYPLTGPQH